jgi:hypothetical protein
MIDLKGVKVPDHFNGIGMHDTAGSEVATLSYQEAKAHARELRDHGITLYKLFGGTTKTSRAKAYVEAGITTAVRFWVLQPWGRPPGSWVTPTDQLKMFADVGVQMFELGWNEFNISGEWPDDKIPTDPAKIARVVVDAWEEGLKACSGVPGAVPLFPSHTPGGNVDHRLCYQAIVAELQRRQLLGTVQHVAVHPRPHNNPPNTVWTTANTVTFDEWRWIRDQFNNGCYLWATEHGYSLKDDQNHNYPQIDLSMWTEYNWNLFVRMNPKHAQAVEPQLAGLFYWVERGWGHWGAWGKDALVDSPVPEMPAPSPLWIRMGERKDELAFSRRGTTIPPIELPIVDLTGVLPWRPDTSRWLKRGGYDFVVVHHTAVDPMGETQEEMISSIKRINTYVTWYWRWPRIGDHYVIDPQGRVYQVNDLLDLTYHAARGNARGVGVDLLGALHRHPPTEAQITALRRLRQKLNIPARPHYDFVNTQCPGKAWWAEKAKLVNTPIDDEPPVEPPGTPYVVEVTYQTGMPLIAGDYPVPGKLLTVAGFNGNQVTVTTGSKAEWGQGGFEVYAMPPGAAHTVTVEEAQYAVQTGDGLTIVAWKPV